MIVCIFIVLRTIVLISQYSRRLSLTVSLQSALEASFQFGGTLLYSRESRRDCFSRDEATLHRCVGLSTNQNRATPHVFVPT